MLTRTLLVVCCLLALALSTGCEKSEPGVTVPENPQPLSGPKMSEGGDTTTRSLDGSIKKP